MVLPAAAGHAHPYGVCRARDVPAPARSLHRLLCIAVDTTTADMSACFLQWWCRTSSSETCFRVVCCVCAESFESTVAQCRPRCTWFHAAFDHYGPFPPELFVAQYTSSSAGNCVHFA